MMWKSVILHLMLQCRIDSTPSAEIVAQQSWRSIVPSSATAHRQTHVPGGRHTVDKEESGNIQGLGKDVKILEDFEGEIAIVQK